MSRTNKRLAILLTLIAVPGLISAEPYTYEHDGEPLFSITFPDGWYVDTDYMAEARAGGGDTGLRILEAMPDDGTKLWFGIWVAPEKVDDFDSALEYVASLDGALFTNVEFSKPQDASFNGMAAKTFHGLARRLNEDVEFAVAVFEPTEGVFTVALYVGRPQTWLKHQAQLDTVVESIAPATR
jgi:hypothetical protein